MKEPKKNLENCPLYLAVIFQEGDLRGLSARVDWSIAIYVLGFKALGPFCHGLTFDLVLGDVVRFDSLNVKTLNP